MALTVDCEEGGEVKITVKDSGCGIESQDLARIFDRLYQVKPGSRNEAESGLGLGLSIAKEIVQLHRGEVMARSESGVGSEFTVCLPVGAGVSELKLHNGEDLTQ